MIRFWLECLCFFSLVFVLNAAPNGMHRVSRQDFATNGPIPGVAVPYQRPFESQNGVYRVQRQDFTNANDVPFSNSYQSPYVNRFSMFNHGYGNLNRTYTPYPKLFVPANQPRSQNPYLAIGLPNYDRIVPASGFQAKTPAPQIPSNEEDGVLPALPHPPRYNLVPTVSETSKSSSFEEDFSSAVEVFDMTEDRKGVCKGANCRKWNPNDEADAVKPIRIKRSIDFEPMPDGTSGKAMYSRYVVSRYYGRPVRRLSPFPYPYHMNDDEYHVYRLPEAHLMKQYFNRFDTASETTTYEPTTIESESTTEQTESPPSVTNLIDYDDNAWAEKNEAEIQTTSSSTDEPTPTPESPTEETTTASLENDYNTGSNDEEFANVFSHRVTRSEEVTSTSKATELEFEYNDSYAPLPAIDFGSTTARDSLQVDYPTNKDLPEDHVIHTRETSSETDINVDFLDLAPIECEFHEEPTQASTQAEDLENQTEPTTTDPPSPTTEDSIQVRYSLSSAFICKLWPEMYTKNKSKVPYDEEDYDVAWNSLCNFIYIDKSRATEAPTTTSTTTESVDVDFFDETDVFGIGVENLESDFQNILEAVEKMQIGGVDGDDIWPELPEPLLDVRGAEIPSAEILPEVLSSDDV